MTVMVAVMAAVGLLLLVAAVGLVVVATAVSFRLELRDTRWCCTAMLQTHRFFWSLSTRSRWLDALIRSLRLWSAAGVVRFFL